jgi:hypothetical protein
MYTVNAPHKLIRFYVTLEWPYWNELQPMKELFFLRVTFRSLAPVDDRVECCCHVVNMF